MPPCRRPRQCLIALSAARESGSGANTLRTHDAPCLAYLTHVELVPREHVAAWGKSIDELMQVGVGNVMEQYPPHIESFAEYGFCMFVQVDIATVAA